MWGSLKLAPISVILVAKIAQEYKASSYQGRVWSVSHSKRWHDGVLTHKDTLLWTMGFKWAIKMGGKAGPFLFIGLLNEATIMRNMFDVLICSHSSCWQKSPLTLICNKYFYQNLNCNLINLQLCKAFYCPLTIPQMRRDRLRFIMWDRMKNVCTMKIFTPCFTNLQKHHAERERTTAST